MLIHITWCSYVNMLLTTHLHSSGDYTPFLDRFCSCIAKHLISLIQKYWILCSYCAKEHLKLMFITAFHYG